MTTAGTIVMVRRAGAGRLHGPPPAPRRDVGRDAVQACLPTPEERAAAWRVALALLVGPRAAAPDRPGPARCEKWQDHEFGSAVLVEAGRHQVGGHFNRMRKRCAKCGHEIHETAWLSTRSATGAAVSAVDDW